MAAVQKSTWVNNQQQLSNILKADTSSILSINNTNNIYKNNHTWKQLRRTETTKKLASLAAIMVFALCNNLEAESLYNYWCQQTNHYVSFQSHCFSVLEWSRFSSTVVVLSLKYLKRAQDKMMLVGQERSAWAACLALAHKYLDDRNYNNKSSSILHKMDINELNRWEREILISLNYDLGIHIVEYEQWRRELKEFINKAINFANEKATRNRIAKPMKETHKKSSGMRTPTTPNSPPYEYPTESIKTQDLENMLKFVLPSQSMPSPQTPPLENQEAATVRTSLFDSSNKINKKPKSSGGPISSNNIHSKHMIRSNRSVADPFYEARRTLTL